MSPVLALRQAALAGVALLATLGALALRGAEEPAPEPTGAVETAPLGGGAWEEAVAGTFGPGRYGERTACDVELTVATLGVAHPVLPCGVDLVVGYEERQVRVEVIERGPAEPGREFDLTEALARRLGFPGEGRIRWRFAE